MTVTFEKRKKDFLKKPDKSNKAGIDSRIAGLCSRLNAAGDYYTLSSCSGRIVLIKDVAEKKPGLFLFRSHEKIRFRELSMAIDSVNYKGAVMFKHEPCIVHVACRDLKKAEILMKKAQSAGMKHSSIIAVSGNRIVVEIIGSEQLALPIMDKGRLLVDDAFLNVLVHKANDGLSRAWRKINKLEGAV